MVLMAYLAGVITPLGAFLGALGGVWWYRRVRRAQAGSEPIHLTPVTPPAPPPPQDQPRANRVAWGRVHPGRSRVRGRR